jgi:hypothetical protein
MSVFTSYAAEVAADLDRLIPGQDPDLIRLYALLVLATGEQTGRREVHDAWSFWRVGGGWTHGPVKDNGARITPYLVPFEELPEEIAAYDDKYVDAIREVARKRAAA